MKFKVGDKVKVKAGGSFASRVHDGQICTLEFVDENTGTLVEESSKEYLNGDKGGVWLSELELVTETKGENMSKVNYHLLSDSVIINHNAKTTAIRRGDSRFDKVVECIRDNRLDEIPEILDTESAFAKKGLTLKDGLLYMGEDSLPETLSKRVIALVENNLPIEPMVNFWNNLKSNPSFNSRKMLYAFLEHNGHPLTQDGCFIAYRGVTSDFKDCHTSTFDNSVGQVVAIDRNKVDDNPNNTCSSGLHVACFDYAKGFGPKLIEVKVNPADVVTVPVDYNGTKMRVCKFEVMAECENIRTEHVYDDSDDQDESDSDLESEDSYYGSY